MPDITLTADVGYGDRDLPVRAETSPPRDVAPGDHPQLPFLAQIEEEQVLVEASGSRLSVTRGANGTARSAHPSGATVTPVVLVAQTDPPTTPPPASPPPEAPPGSSYFDIDYTMIPPGLLTPAFYTLVAGDVLVACGMRVLVPFDDTGVPSATVWDDGGNAAFGPTVAIALNLLPSPQGGMDGLFTPGGGGGWTNPGSAA